MTGCLSLDAIINQLQNLLFSGQLKLNNRFKYPKYYLLMFTIYVLRFFYFEIVILYLFIQHECLLKSF